MDHQLLYFALLTLCENNARILHWKLCGGHFGPDHTKYSEMYEHLGEFMDQTSEQIISMGGNPIGLTQVPQLLEQSNVNAFTVDPSQNYDGRAANQIALDIYKLLYEHAVALATDESLPADVADVYMDHARYFRIEGMYKTTRCLTEGSHSAPPAPSIQEQSPMNGEDGI